MSTRRVTVACSPDADDLFMMRALLEGLIDTGPYRFDITSTPTDALNQLASGADGPDVVALSIAWFPQVSDRYLLLRHGGSMGEGYGPIVVAGRPMAPADLAGRRVAVPGTTTTAARVLALALAEPTGGAGYAPVVVPISPYERIFDAIRAGEVDAGLVIHEGRLTWADEGMHEVLELGRWWADDTGGLPLPLGGNAIRRGLGPDLAPISALLRASIRHGLADRDAAIRWLLAKGGPLRTPERVGRYLDMYANHRTLDWGDDGVHAIEVLLRRLGHDGPVAFAA